jgi:hypothetical protein
MHGKIVSIANDGAAPAKIQVWYRVSQGAMRGSIAQDITRLTGESGPRPGALPTYTQQDKRTMLWHLRLYPKSMFD